MSSVFTCVVGVYIHLPRSSKAFQTLFSSFYLTASCLYICLYTPECVERKIDGYGEAVSGAPCEDIFPFPLLFFFLACVSSVAVSEKVSRS